MKFITNSDILLFCFIFCFVIALTVQIIWILVHKEQKRPKLFRLLFGTCITAICSSYVIGFYICFLIPSVHIVSDNNYETHKFISKEFLSHISREYIYNQSNEALFFKAIGYGSDKHVNESIQIPSGSFVKCEHDIKGYNELPPNHIWSKASGEVRWYLFSASYMSDNNL